MRKSFPFTCDHCAKLGKGMFYLCFTCSFMVYPQCTLSPRIEQSLIVKARIHDHPLTLARKLISFTCDACGKECMGMFYFCTTCSFVSHLDCVSLPSIVKVTRHYHPLNLAYNSLLGSQFDGRVCQLSVKAVNVDYGVYYCSSCDFVSHLHCATSKEDKDATFVQISKDEESIESSTSVLEHEDPCSNESVSPSTFVVKEIKLALDGIEIVAKIKHFSHEEHDLNLDDKLENNEKCDGCMQPIFPPFYASNQCGFFLHKACVELPSTIRHPLHGQHPLILRPS
ncbi:hypothetical protein F2P56_023728 [Juglans regia]|uniref:DC1 domain-containing protein n=1 Tax=Juglans regia TaxID=51240 RepID=A0A833X296_JUGRE|nr:hypothetical protein F2P56_023728 [Juglans regia]